MRLVHLKINISIIFRGQKENYYFTILASQFILYWLKCILMFELKEKSGITWLFLVSWVIKVQFGQFFSWRQFSQILVNNSFNILACSFPSKEDTDEQSMMDWLHVSEGNFKGLKYHNCQKNHVWLIFTELSILFSITEVLSNFIVPAIP